MKCRMLAAVSMVLLATSGAAITPLDEVTFMVPLNLTSLSPDISKVRVKCRIQEMDTRAISDVSSETVVSGGEVVTTLSVNYQRSSGGANTGKTGAYANYSCWLEGFFEPQAIWDEFEPNHTKPAFRLEPRPVPLNGQIMW